MILSATIIVLLTDVRSSAQRLGRTIEQKTKNFFFLFESKINSPVRSDGHTRLNHFYLLLNFLSSLSWGTCWSNVPPHVLTFNVSTLPSHRSVLSRMICALSNTSILNLTPYFISDLSTFTPSPCT